MMKRNVNVKKKNRSWFLVVFLYCLLGSLIIVLMWILFCKKRIMPLWVNIGATVYILIPAASLLYLVCWKGDQWIRQLQGMVYGEEDRETGNTGKIYSLKEVDRLLDDVEQGTNNQYKIKMLRMQAEYTALQNQISPHFLYNTLEMIRSKALENGVTDIAEVTESVAMLFRFRINRPGELATFKEELANVEHYMIIQSFRFGDRYRFWAEYDEEEIEECLMPVLTLQPLIENAAMHGLDSKEDGGNIRLSVVATQNRIRITVSDDGIGMDPKDLKILQDQIYNNREASNPVSRDLKENNSLVNLNQRIKYYFGENYGLSITSTSGIGTSVEVLLPKF